ncbi:MAG: hypothetical protein U0T69_03175 [Chitinophagales bacterium]
MLAHTIAIHSPIHPMPDENVSFFLNKISGKISEVRLYEIEYDIDNNGDPKIDPLKPKVFLKNWQKPKFPIFFTKDKGYGERKYINYIFDITCSKKSNNYQHSISFVTAPYNIKGTEPENCKPIPLYIVSNRDYAMNCVFIQDDDLVEIIEDENCNNDNSRKFFDNVLKSMIYNTVQQEDFLRRFRNSYNFYYNPHVLKERPHSTISKNENNLSFAQLKMNLHSANYEDWTVLSQGPGDPSESRTEFYNFGTFLHESGHGFFNLQDEYDADKANHNDRNPFPNNWKNKDEILKAAKDYHLPSSSISAIKDGVWKLCNENCIMNKSGFFVSSYDLACKLQILNTLYTRAKYTGDCMDLIKNEDKVIEKFNRHMENFRYDVNYSSHFGFIVSWNSADNKYEFKNIEKRPGALPYNKDQYTNKTVIYTIDNKSEVYALPHYLQNLYNKSRRDNTKKYFDVKEDFVLLMPFRGDITEIAININNEKTVLDLADYSDVFNNLLQT